MAVGGELGVQVGVVTRVDAGRVWVSVERLMGGHEAPAFAVAESAPRIVRTGEDPAAPAVVVPRPFAAGDRVVVGFVDGSSSAPVILARLQT